MECLQRWDKKWKAEFERLKSTSLVDLPSPLSCTAATLYPPHNQSTPAQASLGVPLAPPGPDGHVIPPSITPPHLSSITTPDLALSPASAVCSSRPLSKPTPGPIHRSISPHTSPLLWFLHKAKPPPEHLLFTPSWICRWTFLLLAGPGRWLMSLYFWIAVKLSLHLGN